MSAPERSIDMSILPSLLSEGMRHGQVIEKYLTIGNPRRRAERTSPFTGLYSAREAG